MRDERRFVGRSDHLKRLPREYYQGQAYVHWSMTIQDRRTGWLIPILYYKFREILTHTMFRYGLCCPIYCSMPDHFHLLWMGILPGSDQLLAARFFRKQMNPVLEKLGAGFQRESYDHVLGEAERERNAFEDVFEYIARNPERAGLVAENRFREYAYTGCLMPGYPELKIWDEDFWERFWRTHAYLVSNGLITMALTPPSGEGGYGEGS
jgi:REP element-mobilizing transposase RayT